MKSTRESPLAGRRTPRRDTAFAHVSLDGLGEGLGVRAWLLGWGAGHGNRKGNAEIKRLLQLWCCYSYSTCDSQSIERRKMRCRRRLCASATNLSLVVAIGHKTFSSATTTNTSPRGQLPPCRFLAGPRREKPPITRSRPRIKLANPTRNACSAARRRILPVGSPTRWEPVCIISQGGSCLFWLLSAHETEFALCFSTVRWTLGGGRLGSSGEMRAVLCDMRTWLSNNVCDEGGFCV